jgi:hypothetical protein
MYAVMTLTSKSVVSGGKPFIRMSVLVPMTGHRRERLLEYDRAWVVFVGVVTLRTSPIFSRWWLCCVEGVKESKSQ